MEIMITASPGVISLASPLLSYSGFMVLFCSFSLPTPHLPPLPSLCISLYVSDHLFFPLFLSVLPLFCSIRTINNNVYIAEVEKKDQAKKIYEEVHQQGKIAAHVGIR